MSDQKSLERFASKKYRDGYLQSRVRGFIAYQIQALREKLGMTQAQFAELTDKKQSVISRLESTEYGKVSVQTLLDIACATNVALVVRFASYPEFLDQTRNMSLEALQPRTIEETLSDQHASRQIVGSAYRHFLTASAATESGQPANVQAMSLTTGAPVLGSPALTVAMTGQQDDYVANDNTSMLANGAASRAYSFGRPFAGQLNQLGAA